MKEVFQTACIAIAKNTTMQVECTIKDVQKIGWIFLQIRGQLTEATEADSERDSALFSPCSAFGFVVLTGGRLRLKT